MTVITDLYFSPLVMLCLQLARTMVNEQHNSGIAGSGVGYANSRTTVNTFFPNWEHVHPLHDKLMKKTEVMYILRARLKAVWPVVGLKTEVIYSLCK